MVWVREINVRGPAGPSGGIDPNDPAMAASVAAAVNARLQAENIMRAYPEEPVTRSTLASIPFRWTQKSLSAPVPQNVTATVEGTWSGTAQRQGDVLMLDENGRIRDSQLPATAARLSDIPDVPEVTPGASMARRISDSLPFFTARLALAKTKRAPFHVVYVGSSTTASHPGYVGPLNTRLQEAYPVANPSDIQQRASGLVTAQTNAGLHGYNVGVGGTTAGGETQPYLPPSRVDNIYSRIEPDVFQHMIGANDWRRQEPDTYEAHLRGVLDYIDSKAAKPVQHVLVHSYARMDYESTAIPWSEYLARLRSIEADCPNVTVFDVSGQYRAIGVYKDGPNYFNYLKTDQIHLTSDGESFMEQTLAAMYLA